MKKEVKIQFGDLSDWLWANRDFLEQIAKKQNCPLDEAELFITIEEPKKPRTTGEFSQNHALNGIIQQICEETGQDFNAVKIFLKSEAVAHGYPQETEKKLIDGILQEVPKVDFWGNPVGISESKASTVDCSILIDTAIAFAQTELGITLKM